MGKRVKEGKNGKVISWLDFLEGGKRA